jgi:hypothetical protein
MTEKHKSHLFGLAQHVERQIRRLHRNKKAISVVVGTVVLTAAVLAMGIAVMYWAQSMGKIANREYSRAVIDNSNAVLERLSFEYISYGAGGQLNINVINSGEANLTVVRAYIWNSLHVAVGTYSVERNTLSFTQIGGGTATNAINVGNERCIVVYSILPEDVYTVRIVTQRGRNFDWTFSVT